MTTSLTHPVFAAQLNSKFRVSADGQPPVELELIEVGELLESPGQERFTIKFRGPAAPLVPQGMYPFEHDTMGKFTLFIVPIEEKDGSLFYEAVFNRLRK